MCCTVGGPGPALAPVAGRNTVLELDIAAAATAPAGYAIILSNCTAASPKCEKDTFDLFQEQPYTNPGKTDLIRKFIPRGKWDVKVWGGTVGALIWPLMMWMLAGIRWCKLLEWPWNIIQTEKVKNTYKNRRHKIKAYIESDNKAVTCCPLIVATGMEEVEGKGLSRVTVMWLATLGIWAWLEAGAGAMRRLGIGDFRTA